MTTKVQLTYLTTDELAERIKYDARTIRTRMVDSVLKEGRHYLRPFGGRKLLFVWEAIQEDMHPEGRSFEASVSASSAKAETLEPSGSARPVVPPAAQDDWSPLEESYLRGSWGIRAISQICKELGRDRHVVFAKAEELGFKHPDKWEESEIQLLQTQFGASKHAELARKLGRPLTEIMRKAAKLGLAKPKRADAWSDQEDSLLREHVGPMSIDDVHTKYFLASKDGPKAEFNRTHTAVYQRCRTLGLLPKHASKSQH